MGTSKMTASGQYQADTLVLKLEAFILQHRLFRKDDLLLLAVSGGLDSVILCQLMHVLGYRFQIAHCNFSLRGEESDRDEQFVRSLAENLGVHVHVKAFDTLSYAQAQKLSIQEAARNLRYDWFKELLRAGLPGQGGHRAFLLTAHHMDDNVETMLFHFFRGTGISGMRGMLPASGHILRPLLFASRAELQEYATTKNLNWVEDSSNLSDAYDRNFIRLQLLPLLEQRFPKVRENLGQNLKRFQDVESLYAQACLTWKKKLLKDDPAGWKRIPVEALRLSPAPRTILWELLKEYGFSVHQAEQALQLLHAESGRFVATGTHRILRNRSWLILSTITSEDLSIYIAAEGQQQVPTSGGTLWIHIHSHPPEGLKDEGLFSARLDAADIHYPLIIRKWKAGDYMYPLGMRKKKKIARMLIDAKLSHDQKKDVWVVESNKRILWLVGLRIDERCKITASTKSHIHLRWQKPA